MDYRSLLKLCDTKYQTYEELNNHKQFTCTDYICMPNVDDVVFDAPEDRIKQLTGSVFLKKTKSYWLVDSSTLRDIFSVNASGEVQTETVSSLKVNVVPKCNIDIKKLYALKESNPKEFAKITNCLNPEDDEHYLVFGSYPQRDVDNATNSLLEKLFNGGNLIFPLHSCPCWYTINGNEDVVHNDKFLTKLLPVFDYNGQKYVRCASADYNNKFYAKWVKIEDIKWKITNWESLPSFINNKNVSTTCFDSITCISENALIPNLPFYSLYNDCNNMLWQNSLIRAFLNSVNLEKSDRDANFLAINNYDFTNSGFLNQGMNPERVEATEYVVPASEHQICDFAFTGCMHLEYIVIPNHVTLIQNNAFVNLNNNVQIKITPNENLRYNEQAFMYAKLKFIYLDVTGNHIILTKQQHLELYKNYIEFNYSVDTLKKFLDNNFRKNYIMCQKLYKDKKIKFIPPEYTLKAFPNECFECYYINKNHLRWKKLITKLELLELPEDWRNNALFGLMKIHFAIGGFSRNQGESERAYDFIVDKFFNSIENYCNNSKYYLAMDLSQNYTGLKLTKYYNKTFASFFMKYYKPNFMTFSLPDKYGELQNSKDYLAEVHNNFENILAIVPNKKLSGTSKSALLTPVFLAEHCKAYTYDHITKENKELSELIAPYCYTEAEFEKMQDILKIAKQIKDISSITSFNDEDNHPIKFRLLEKDDIYAFITGHKLNSCQNLKSRGANCLEDGYTNPDAGFIVFENAENNDLLAQAYIWYNKEAQTLCFDNIDMPLKLVDKLSENDRHGISPNITNLLQSIERAANSISASMQKHGYPIRSVTIGLGYCSLRHILMEKYKLINNNLVLSHGMYRGYSDAGKEQVELLKND